MSTKSGKQCGGSVASDRVVQFANRGLASLEDYKFKSSLPSIEDVTSYPVLYQTAGASHKSKSKKLTKRKTGRKLKRSVGSKRKRSVGSKRKRSVGSKRKRSVGKRLFNRTLKKKYRQKGGNFLGMAGCGPVNTPDAGRKYSNLFTKSGSCPGPDFYRNPPGLEKAGSGQGSTFGPGAPFPFI